MGGKKPLLLKNPFSRFDLAGDRAVFNRIVADMTEHGGLLAPSDHWNWNLGKAKSNGEVGPEAYTDELFDTSYAQLKMMLNPWVGVTGMKYVDETAFLKYETFLRAVDHLRLLPADVVGYGQSNGWIEADLGSVMDTNLIAAFLGRPAGERITVCEVGGGYGRLAEVILGGLWQSVHYVLVDAVPGSLMYAYEYLRNQLPELRIGSYYSGDAYSDTFQCYIMPAWHAAQLGDSAFDVCVNVESMQEMSQNHVDYYLALFNRVTRPEGEIYLSNARDYVFRGNWNIPPQWETLFLHNTPRSWTADHPTHILRKRNGDFSAEREMLEGAFRQQVEAWHQRRDLAEQRQHVADRDRICATLNKTIAELRSEADEGCWQRLRRLLGKWSR